MGLYLSAPRCTALPPEAVLRPPAATSKFHTSLLCVRTCYVPEYSYELLTGIFCCLWLKFAWFPCRFLFCWCVHSLLLFPRQLFIFFLFIFLSFGFLYVWIEPNYIPFDSADGKYKLVLDLNTLSFRHEEITDKSCTRKQTFRMTVSSINLLPRWIKMCLLVQNMFVRRREHRCSLWSQSEGNVILFFGVCQVKLGLLFHYVLRLCYVWIFLIWN